MATLYSESLNNVNSESHISNFSEMLCNVQMKTNDEVRRQNLLIAIERAGSAAKLAALANTSPAYISQIRNMTPDSKSGTPKTMGDDMARRIEAAIGEPTGWMDFVHSAAEGSAEVERLLKIIPGAQRVRVIEDDDPSLVQIRSVKIRVQAGITGFTVDPEYDDGETYGVPRRWVEQNGFHRESMVRTKVQGESMEPSLYHGDSIVVNTADKQPVSGSVYIINYEGEAVVKRLHRDAGQWWLVSDNPDQRKFHRQLCKGADCIIVGKVVRKESNHI